MPRKSDPAGFCGYCGTRMERKRFDGRLEDRTVFLKRVYCDQDCMTLGYVSDAPSQQALMWRARKFRGPRCESCGAMTRLQAHHIDGRRANNSPENIQTLCVSCHASHHHHARRAGLVVAGRMESGGLDIPCHVALIV